MTVSGTRGPHRPERRPTSGPPGAPAYVEPVRRPTAARRALDPWRVLAALVAASLVLGACGGSGAPPAATLPAAAASPPGRAVPLWFVHADRLFPVGRDLPPDDPRVAVEAVLAGPDDVERDVLDAGTAAPGGTTIASYDEAEGVVSIDLAAPPVEPRDVGLLAGQVVFTATGFPGVEGVVLTVDGAALRLPDGTMVEGPLTRRGVVDLVAGEVPPPDGEEGEPPVATTTTTLGEGPLPSIFPPPPRGAPRQLLPDLLVDRPVARERLGPIVTVAGQAVRSASADRVLVTVVDRTNRVVATSATSVVDGRFSVELGLAGAALGLGAVLVRALAADGETVDEDAPAYRVPVVLVG